MVSDSSGCDPHRLRHLLDDQLPEPSQAELAEHLETCRACRRKLESLAGDASLWRDAARFLQPEGPRDSSAAQLGQRSEPVAGTEGPRLRAERDAALGFLAPSDDPQKLGRLGPYEIVEVIGGGGMGVVVKGFDASLNRYVAVKVLSPHLAGSGAARRRFAREAQAAAAVLHENVVPIHAVDSAAGLPYLVMPFIRGKSLEARIRQTGPLELKEILRIGMQTAAGLAAAHAQGLVHRDVKPANILLENGVERVLLTDFGLARTVDDAALTRSGLLAGTPQYMAAEQAKGETVDHRADLFSLGSVLYAMCTGHSPFRAETTMGVLRRICDSRPRPVRDVNPEIPEWLAEIINKLHEKDPGDRFQSASEVAELLGRHLAHLQHPAAVPMPARLPASRRSTRRRRVSKTFVATAAAMVLLLGGLAATEALRVTNLLGVLGTIPSANDSAPTPESSSPPNTTGPEQDAGAPQPAFKAVPPHLLYWDDGLERPLDDIREEVRRIEAAANPQAGHGASSNAPSVVDRQVSELEEELNDRWP
jgi:serine/threonine-protein kinase